MIRSDTASQDKVAGLPLATWNDKDQDDSIRHMAPMAQDFYAAFGPGLGNETIDTIDPNGVALAAIQGRNQLVREENANPKERLSEKDAQIEELRARLERLEALVRMAKTRPTVTKAPHPSPSHCWAGEGRFTGRPRRFAPGSVR